MGVMSTWRRALGPFVLGLALSATVPACAGRPPIPPRGVTLNFPMSEQLRRALRSPTDSGDPKDYR